MLNFEVTIAVPSVANRKIMAAEAAIIAQLVLIPIVTSNYDATIAPIIIAMIPSTVPTAITPIELYARTIVLRTRTIVAVAVVVAVAAYVNAEPFSARYRWHCDGNRSQRGQG